MLFGPKPIYGRNLKGRHILRLGLFYVRVRLRVMAKIISQYNVHVMSLRQMRVELTDLNLSGE